MVRPLVEGALCSKQESGAKLAARFTGAKILTEQKSAYGISIIHIFFAI